VLTSVHADRPKLCRRNQHSEIEIGVRKKIFTQLHVQAHCVNKGLNISNV